MDDSVNFRSLDPSWITERIAELGGQLLASFPVVGGVVTVSDREGTLAETSFGYANRESATPASANFAYEIGSISKVLAGLVVARLVTEGRLALDEVVSNVLPRISGAVVRSDATVRDLCNHTAGAIVGSDTLPDDAGEIWYARDARATYVSPARFHYSNLGYQLLGEVVRSRTGRSLVDLEREWILEPLNMRHARARITHDDRARMAVGYWPARTDQPWVPGAPLSPAPWFESDSASGNALATSSDMVLLAAEILRAAGGELRGAHSATVITPQAYELATTTLAPQGEPFATHDGLLTVGESRYGLGVNVATIDGLFCLTHGGGMVGYSTFLIVDCTSGVAVSVLTSANGDCLGAQLLARAVHGEIVRRRRNTSSPSGVDLRCAVVVGRSGELPFSEECVGRFTSDRDHTELHVTHEGAGSPVTVSTGGRAGGLYRLPSGRFVTDHPQFRRFLLDCPSGTGGWIYGGTRYARDAPGPPLGESSNPLVGRYRSFSPWYPEFRVVERDAKLWLAAPGGTEAPDGDEELVELSPGLYRVGAADWLPERLVVGSIVNGRAVALVRDGCPYSRATGE